jgi:hypothetical protein
MARTTTYNHGRAERSHEPDRQDTAGAAEARVSLKLAAERYNASRYGSDAGARLTAAALFTLRGKAIHYYGQLNQVDPRRRLPDDLRELHEHAAVDRAFACLQNAAMAYSNTRGGADASLEFTRAAIAELCTAAVVYVESLLEIAAEPASKPAREGDRRGREHGDAVLVLGEEP